MELVDKIKNNVWETEHVAEKFAASVALSTHLPYLTPYTSEELSKFRLFKVKDADIGFALTSDNEIISVHNNSGQNGVGRDLVLKAVELGGQKVFHFDGWLTNFYRKLDFVEDKRQRMAWDDQFAPKGWKYEAINVLDPKHSVYAYEFFLDIHSADIRFDVQKRYKAGKPDLVTRYITKKL